MKGYYTHRKSLSITSKYWIYIIISYLFIIQVSYNVHIDCNLFVYITYTSAYLVLCVNGGSFVHQEGRDIQFTKMQSCPAPLIWKHELICENFDNILDNIKFICVLFFPCFLFYLLFIFLLEIINISKQH